MDDYSNLIYIDADGVGWFEDENGDLYPVELPEDFELPENPPYDGELIYDGNEYVDRNLTDQEIFDTIYSDDEDVSTGYTEYDVTMQDYLDGTATLSSVMSEDGENIIPEIHHFPLPATIAEAIGIPLETDNESIFDGDEVLIPEPQSNKKSSPFDSTNHTPVTMTQEEEEEYEAYWDDLAQHGFYPQSYSNRPSYD